MLAAGISWEPHLRALRAPVAALAPGESQTAPGSKAAACGGDGGAHTAIVEASRMSTTPLLRIRDWAGRFENSRTRELRNLTWLPVPTALDSDFYTAVMDHPDGAAHFGVAIALRVLATKSTPRGDLRREDGRAHDAQSLARVLRVPQPLIETAIQRLLEIGDIETVSVKPRRINRPTWQDTAARPQDIATTPQDVATSRRLSALEGKGRESSSSSKGIKKKGSEAPERNDRTGTEPRARESAAIEHPLATTPDSLKRDDDDDLDPPEYTLQRLFEANGDVLTSDTLRKLRENLEVRGVSLSEFATEAKRRLKPNGHIVSATAIALDLAKKFRSKSTPAQMPHAPKPEKPKCPTCGCEPGRGLVLSGNRVVPCECATPEYRAEFAAKEAERAARRSPAREGAA